MNFSFEVLLSALPQSARRNASLEGEMAREPKQRFLAEPLKQTALMVTGGRMPERRLLTRVGLSGGTRAVNPFTGMPGKLLVLWRWRRGGGRQTPNRIVQSPG